MPLKLLNYQLGEGVGGGFQCKKIIQNKSDNYNSMLKHAFVLRYKPTIQTIYTNK